MCTFLHIKDTSGRLTRGCGVVSGYCSCRTRPEFMGNRRHVDCFLQGYALLSQMESKRTATNSRQAMTSLKFAEFGLQGTPRGPVTLLEKGSIFTALSSV